MPPLQIACAILVPLFWGCQFVAIKIGLAQFPPLFFLALRFIAIALILVPFVARPSRVQVGPIIAISVFLSALNFGLFYIGLGLGSGSTTAVAYQLATPFIILLSWPMLGERPSLRTTAGVALALVGVVAASGGMSVEPLATWFVVGSALAYALGNVLAKRHGPFNALTLLAWMSVFTVPQVMIASMILERGQVASLMNADLHGWVALAYTVLIGGVAGFGLWFWLIARCSMARIAPFGLLMPVFAIMASVLVLGERLTPMLLTGGVIALAGVAMTQAGSGSATRAH